MDQFPDHQEEVQDAESRKGSPDPGLIEQGCNPDGEHGQENAPDLGPRQQHEQEPDIDQIAHVDDDREKSEGTHPIIVTVPPFRALFCPVFGGDQEVPA